MHFLKKEIKTHTQSRKSSNKDSDILVFSLLVKLTHILQVTIPRPDFFTCSFMDNFSQVVFFGQWLKEGGQRSYTGKEQYIFARQASCELQDVQQHFRFLTIYICDQDCSQRLPNAPWGSNHGDPWMKKNTIMYCSSLSFPIQLVLGFLSFHTS